MKVIVCDRLYDTDKSELLDQKKLMNCCYELYRTHKGNLFIIDRILGKLIIDCQEVKYLLGLYFPDKYIELYGEVEDA